MHRKRRQHRTDRENPTDQTGVPADLSTTRFLFVGERPTGRAARIGATLQNGRLAGKTLHGALRALKVDPHRQQYLNLYCWPDANPADEASEEETCREIEHRARSGYVVVGLGHKVSRRLWVHCIPHLRLIHPAARGTIRRTECYRLHVATILGRGLRGGPRWLP